MKPARLSLAITVETFPLCAMVCHAVSAIRTAVSSMGLKTFTAPLPEWSVFAFQSDCACHEERSTPSIRAWAYKAFSGLSRWQVPSVNRNSFAFGCRASQSKGPPLLVLLDQG